MLSILSLEQPKRNLRADNFTQLDDKIRNDAIEPYEICVHLFRSKNTKRQPEKLSLLKKAALMPVSNLIERLRTERRPGGREQNPSHLARAPSGCQDGRRSVLFTEARRAFGTRLSTSFRSAEANGSQAETTVGLRFFPVGWPSPIIRRLKMVVYAMEDLARREYGHFPVSAKPIDETQIHQRLPSYHEACGEMTVSRYRQAFKRGIRLFEAASIRASVFLQKYSRPRRPREPCRPIGIRTLPPFHVVLDACQAILDEVEASTDIGENILYYALAACAMYVALGDDLGENLPRYERSSSWSFASVLFRELLRLGTR